MFYIKKEYVINCIPSYSIFILFLQHFLHVSFDHLNQQRELPVSEDDFEQLVL